MIVGVVFSGFLVLGFRLWVLFRRVKIRKEVVLLFVVGLLWAVVVFIFSSFGEFWVRRKGEFWE